MHQGWDSVRFADLLGVAMQETGLNQQSLARLAHLNAAVISRWRAGATRPTYDNVLKLTDALDEKYGPQPGRRLAFLAAAGYGPATGSAADGDDSDRQRTVRALEVLLADVEAGRVSGTQAPEILRDAVRRMASRVDGFETSERDEDRRGA